MKRALLISLLVTILFNDAISQVYSPVKWTFETKKISNDVYELYFDAVIDKGWHMYGLKIPEGGPLPTEIKFADEQDIRFLTELKSLQKPEVKFDSTFEMQVELFDTKVRFVRKVKLEEGNSLELKGQVTFMACDDSRCLPPKDVDFNFRINNTSKKEISPSKGDDTLSTKVIEPADTITTGKSVGTSDSVPDIDKIIEDEVVSGMGEEKKKSLLALFLLALVAGLGAILTPCVYPIIPLTVSFFMRNTSRRKAIWNGIAFGLSIVFIYTLVGALAGIFKIDLVRLVSSHWLPNLIFMFIFIALAASFFGLFEITLPGSLSNKIDQQADKGGVLGPFFMALATVIISFSCTGPIVGVVLGSALQGELVRPIVGMFGFSLSFALPFTLLAIFPGFMKSMPKSGGWLNSVKVVFAFILLAFSLVFLTNLGLKLVTREVVLAIAIVIFALLGLYLLGKLKFSHDSDLPHVSVFRLIMAIAAFSFSIYMIPGLFGAPLQTIAPFLPPIETGSFTISTTRNISDAKEIAVSNSLCDEQPKYADVLEFPLGLQGYFDYEEALRCAKKLNKPVLLDFAGHSCKNCKKMYAEVWSDSRVHSMLKNDFVLSALYTDDRTELAKEDQVISSLDGKLKNTIGKKFNDLQISKFGTNALPLYVIVNPNGEVLTSQKYYTYSSDVDAFLVFLEEGIRNFKK